MLFSLSLSLSLSLSVSSNLHIFSSKPLFIQNSHFKMSVHPNSDYPSHPEVLSPVCLSLVSPPPPLPPPSLDPLALPLEKKKGDRDWSEEEEEPLLLQWTPLEFFFDKFRPLH